MAPVRSKLQTELGRITDGVREMGRLVERAVMRAVKALADQDVELGQQVIEDDEAINQLRFDIEAVCFAAMATQQPAAGDLRTIVAALNIITDLERMGDHAKGIGQIVINVEGEPLFLPAQKTPRMAKAVCQMIRTSVEAFVEGDVGKARRSFGLDDHVDGLYREVFESVIHAMVTRRQGVHKGMHLLFAAHNLERIGDRATNISERAIFSQTGVMEEQNR
jgi:phosphate transport system protein